MAEIIDLTSYLYKKESDHVEELSQRLADLITDLGIKEQYEMYMSEEDDYIYGMPFIYTMLPPQETSQVKSLADVTDVLTMLTITLDGMGYSNWANQISSIVGEMFSSGSFKEC